MAWFPSKVLAALLVLGSAASAAPRGTVAKIDRIVVVAAGIAIWDSEVEEQMSVADAKRDVTIERLIDEAIALAWAKHMRIEVVDAEIDAALAEIEKQNNIDAAGLDKILAEKHLRRGTYRQMLWRQLMMLRMANQQFHDVTVADREAARAKWTLEQRRTVHIERRP